ncbi:unnamed protein product [Cyprideis torosa]|uniref:Uncharacterized protein n=1 Tax=Cyprideis torosa TaxID=163714 RepID=A0A7R8WII2_9CRUS|nr:unnamed protein product [Cyprideis torosa]CAG0894750.1 unnamed protein product [Cyprideis torosa]
MRLHDGLNIILGISLLLPTTVVVETNLCEDLIRKFPHYKFEIESLDLSAFIEDIIIEVLENKLLDLMLSNGGKLNFLPTSMTFLNSLETEVSNTTLEGINNFWFSNEETKIGDVVDDGMPFKTVMGFEHLRTSYNFDLHFFNICIVQSRVYMSFEFMDLMFEQRSHPNNMQAHLGSSLPKIMLGIALLSSVNEADIFENLVSVLPSIGLNFLGSKFPGFMRSMILDVLEDKIYEAVKKTGGKVDLRDTSETFLYCIEAKLTNATLEGLDSFWFSKGTMLAEVLNNGMSFKSIVGFENLLASYNFDLKLFDISILQRRIHMNIEFVDAVVEVELGKLPDLFSALEDAMINGKLQQSVFESSAPKLKSVRESIS